MHATSTGNIAFGRDLNEIKLTKKITVTDIKRK